MKTPQKIELHRKQKMLEITFSDARYELGAEFLRVFSPSAEVKGHGPGQEVLQHGKLNVGINTIEPNGHYAIRILFDDGHDSGIYSWDYLAKLGQEQDQLWHEYLNRLNEAKLSRDPDTTVVKMFE